MVRQIPLFTAIQEGTQVRYDSAAEDADAGGAGRTAFVERPDELVIHKWSDKNSLQAALTLAQEKWGSFMVTGNAKFKKLCAMLAVRCGFKINNSEMQDLIRQEQENLLQKRKAKMQAMLESSKGQHSGLKARGPVAD